LAFLFWAAGKTRRVILILIEGFIMKQFLTFIVIFSKLIFAQWEWYSPQLTDNFLSGMAFINKSTGFIVGDNGIILKSTDSGNNWEIININSSDWFTSIAFTSENTGYLTSLNGDLFKTSDAGKNWNLIHHFNYSIDKIIFPNDKKGFMVGYNFAAYSNDKGNTWSKFNWTNQNIYYKSIYFKDKNNGWIDNSNGWQIKTIDGGDTWIVDSSTNTPQVNFAIGAKYYSLLFDGNIAISYNGGLNWDTVNVVETYYDFNSIYFSDSLNGIICSKYLKAYITNNGGRTWAALYDANNIRINGETMTHYNNNVWIAGNYFFVFKSSDYGKTWNYNKTKKYLELYNYSFNNISMINGSTIYVSGNYLYWDGANLYKSEIIKTTDGGKTWEQVFFSDKFKLNAISFKSRLNGVCAGESGRVFVTTDGGNSWSENDLNSKDEIKDIYLTDNNTIWVVANGIYKKGPNDDLWKKVSDEGNGSKIKFVNNNIGWYTKNIMQYIGDKDIYYYGAIYKTTNSGISWEKSFDIDKNITDFSTYSDNHIIISCGNIYASSDGGDKWIKLNMPTDETSINKISFVNDSVMYCVGKSIYKSTNRGINWEKEQMKYNSNISDIRFVNDSSGLAVGDYGKIIKYGRYKVVSTIKNDYPYLPKNYALYQNYPNPFNPSTIIRYSIPKTCYVLLKVYNILGKEVATLVNQEKTTGNYEINFYANNLSSGVYFYRIQAGNFTDTKKFVLLR
jgi:photosystem II stability/assembly factor-like uncharacterized protein